MKFGAYICIQSGVIDIFSKLQGGGRRHLGFVWVSHGPFTMPHSWCVPPVKILSWSAKHFSSYEDLIFFSFRLKSPIHAPKISVFGGFYPQNLGTDRSDPQKALPWAEWRVLSPYWPRSDLRCDPWPFLRNQKKEKKTPPDSAKLAIRPDHPRRRIEIKVCMPGGLRCIILYFKFYQNRSSSFAAVGGRKSPFPITLANGLYNSLYYRTSRDSMLHIQLCTE